MTSNHLLRCFIASCLIVATLSSCSFEWRMNKRYRRAERKIEKLTIKHPKLLQKDTVVDTLKVVIPSIKKDTAFSIDVDTVIITNDRLVIRYERVGDTIRLSGECKTDTIYKRVEVPVERIVVRKQTFIEQLTKWIKGGWWIALLFLLILAIAKIGLRFIKPF